MYQALALYKELVPMLQNLVWWTVRRITKANEASWLLNDFWWYAFLVDGCQDLCYDGKTRTAKTELIILNRLEIAQSRNKQTSKKKVTKSNRSMPTVKVWIFVTQSVTKEPSRDQAPIDSMILTNRKGLA